MATGPKPPSIRLWLREPLQIPKILAAPFRQPDTFASFGAGRPALVIPGMLSGDGSTALLRSSLDIAGFLSSGWGRPFNAQVDEAAVQMLQERLATMTEQAGLPAVVIGWSLGGFYARVLASRMPEHVSLVVTMGTPFSGDRHSNRAWKLYEFLNDHSVDDTPFNGELLAKPPVRTLALWSSVDGIVAPECARGKADESDRQIEFQFPHFAMGTSKPAIRRILSILREELG